MNRVWPVAALFVMAAAIALPCIEQCGSLWPDAARYGNAASMIHDWLLSGDWTQPLAFAQQNYRQYPGFGIPYHPPVYPGMLGLSFVIFGEDYTTARVFVASCLALIGVAFMWTEREMGRAAVPALLGAMMVVSLPELMVWSRDTMSEVPALAMFLLATTCFVRWSRGGSPWLLVLAYALAECAFLSRVTTATLMPAWYLWLFTTERWKLAFSKTSIVFGVLYVGVNAAWVKLVVAPLSQYEITNSVIWNAAEPFSLRILLAYLESVPAAAGWGTLALCLIGLVFGFLRRKEAGEEPGFPRLWLIWAGVVLLALLYKGIYEQRYITFGIVALGGFAAAAIALVARRVGLGLGAVLALAGVAANVATVYPVPRGISGYPEVVSSLSKTTDHGNILTAMWYDQDFMFRLRLTDPTV
ncbi:MAG: glycosyltransferase family 39 protein, partial [Pseudomonadota bacterium]